MDLNCPQRRSNRLTGFDYSRDGVYYVTINTFNKQCIFGDINNMAKTENKYGLIADSCWRSIPAHFPNVVLLDYIIMPNHVHGIVVIKKKTGAACCAPTEKKQGPVKGSLGAIIRFFKSAVTKSINSDRLTIWPVWQRSYHDEIVFNNNQLQNIIAYIRSNPANWESENRI